jgi:transcriptional regulator with XRE-family HTH domain
VPVLHDGAPVGGSSPPSFGRWLRKSRELRGLSLDEVIVETKLPARIVTALETDDTVAMPDRAYALQYARAVALAVGLDPEDVALRYEEWLLSLPPTTLPPPPHVPTGPVEKALAPMQRLAAIPGRISKDPLVWTVLLLTAAACAAILLSR